MRRCRAKLDDCEEGQRHAGSEGWTTNIGEPLPTSFVFAPMRFLAGMGTYMNRQCAALDEALVAITPGANVGTVVGVDAVMSDEVRLAIELLHIGHGG